ncbi:MAG: M28 family peptidase [Planctomycetota bacterium]|jgi:hypothetical protein
MRAVLVLVVLVAIAAADEVAVLSHDIVLRIDPATMSFVSYDTVRVRGPGRLRAAAAGLVEVSGHDAESSGGDLDVPNGVHEFRFRYAGTLYTIDEAGSYLTNAFFVPSSRRARFTITIGVPPPHRAVAPGRRLDEWEADGLRFVTHACDEPASRVVVATGPWEVDEATIDGLSCRTYLQRRDRDDATTLLATLRAAVPRYSLLFGRSLREIGRFDVVAGSFGPSRGYGGFTLLDDIALPDVSGRVEHALVHAWFGGIVRVHAGRGDWSAGLTTYFADYGAAERAGTDATYRASVARRFSLRFAAGFERPLRPVQASPPDAGIDSGKGSMVFHMLARELGRARFLEAVRHALKTYAGDRFGWDGWVTVLGEGAGRDLGPWFEPWLGRPGAPILEIGTLKVTGNVVAGTIRQAQPGAAYPLRIPVRVTTKAGREEHVVLSASKETAFSLTTKAPPRRIAIDPEHHIFRKTPRDRVAPCLEAVLTATMRVGYGDAARLRRLGVERRVGEPPANAAVLAIGLPPEIKDTLLSGARQQDPSLRIETGRFEIRGKGYGQPGDALLFSSHVPGMPPVTFFHGNAPAAYAPTDDLRAYALDSWVVFRDGRPVARGSYHTDRSVRAKITPARRGEVEPLVRDLLYLTDPIHAGREVGTMAAFKLANELRGQMHNAGLKVLPWPSVRIPRGSVSGRELVILDGDEKVRLKDAFYPFHSSASPRNAPVFERVVEHPAQDVEGALVLLPEDAPLEVVKEYAENDAAVVAVVARDEALTKRAREAVWDGAVPPALRQRYAPDRTSVSTAVSDLLARGDVGVLNFPYIYLRPSAAAELKRRGAGGVLKYAIRRTRVETSNLIGVLGDPRQQGVLLSAHWNGVGMIGGRPVQAASDNAAGVAVVLWVAARLKRDFDRGVLKRPVVVALFGANQAGLAGSRQFAAALGSSRCPVARPLQAVNVDGVGSVAGYRVHVLGRSRHAELNEAFLAASKGTGLVLGRDVGEAAYAASSDHWPLHQAGIPAVTIFSADPRAVDGPFDTVDLVDVETMRRVGRTVYRMVRDLASR